MSQPLEQFLATRNASRPPLVIDVGPDASAWPVVLVRASELAALVRVMHVSANNPANEHLCLDVRPFVDGLPARAGMFGMEHGRRIPGLRPEQCDGTSHGLPAAALLSVIVGHQHDTPGHRMAWSCDLDAPNLWQADGWSLANDHGAWWLTAPPHAGLAPMFLSTDLPTAFDRAGAVIAAVRERSEPGLRP